jgi:hypothetical protein
MTDVITFAYRRLACAILYRAVLDARSGNGQAAWARRWLARDPWAGDLLDALGYDRRVVRQWVQELKPLEQPALL